MRVVALLVTAFDLPEVPGCWGVLGLPAGPGWDVDQEGEVQGSGGLAKEGGLRQCSPEHLDSCDNTEQGRTHGRRARQ